MAHRVTLIPGDGIGPEIAEAARRAIEATGVQIDWDVQQAGSDAIARTGTPLPPEVVESVRRNKVAIKGPITTPIGKGFRSVNVGLRQALNLYANVRPCRTYRGVRSKYEGVDLVIVRENTEDLYAGVEAAIGSAEVGRVASVFPSATAKRSWDDAAIGIKLITRSASERIVRYAFEYARAHGRKKVTAVHKANIMKFTDGLFLEVSADVATRYPDIEYEDRIVDNLCMQLVQKPELYDVLVLPNLYGDIVSDLAAGIVGGLGLAPGVNVGDDTVLFEPIHGSAPKYTGQNKVNPMAMMFCGVMMLRHIGEGDASARLERVLTDMIADGTCVTYDMKPDRNDPTAVGTSAVADCVVARLERG